MSPPLHLSSYGNGGQILRIYEKKPWRTSLLLFPVSLASVWRLEPPPQALSSPGVGLRVAGGCQMVVETETASLRILEAKENITDPLPCVDFARIYSCETWGWGAVQW